MAKKPIPERAGSYKPGRNALGQILPGHTGNPNGRPKKVTLEERVTRAIGPQSEEIIAERLAQGVIRASEKFELGTRLGKFEIEMLDWWLKRRWPVPQKIEAKIEDDGRRDPPEIPTSDDRARAVAAILGGDGDEDSPQPNVEGTETVQ